MSKLTQMNKIGHIGRFLSKVPVP